MSDGRCIHCGKKGHYSMMCPSKPSFSYEWMERNIDHGPKNDDTARTLKLDKKKRFSIGKSLW